MKISLVSPETRALMEQVLASGEGAEEVSGRVAMLLAGSSLTTSKGVSKGPGREVEAVSYDSGKKYNERMMRDYKIDTSSQQTWQERAGS